MTDALSSQLQSSLAGRYEIERELGRGGMATVYLARDVKHQRLVALKVLDPELGAVLGAERFLSEIRVTANLQHPHLLPLFDSGEANGLLYYVMPFVEGESLRARLNREKQLPIDEAVHIASAAAQALDYAHVHGVIHRDLKPENILLQHGQPVVADFGIALAIAQAGGQRVTQTGLSLGTPQYMSPEQATGDRQIDGRTDIYSLGALTYEMLTGEPPHTGNTAQAVIGRLMTESPRPISAVRKSVPAPVDAAVARALEKLPADRFATAAQFAEALQGKTVVLGSTAASPRRAPALAPLGTALVAMTAVAMTAVAAIGWWRAAHRTTDRSPTRFVLSLDSATITTLSGSSAVAVSPDGTTIAYLASDHPNGAPHIFVRRLSDLDARPLAGTDGTRALFFSADGQSLGFQSGTEVKRIDVSGGPATSFGDIGAFLTGASWNARGDIILSTNAGQLLLITVGNARRVIPRDPALGRADIRFPMWLDGADDEFLSAVWRSTPGVALGELFAIDARSGKARDVGVKGLLPVGLVNDILLYQGEEGNVYGVRFDVHRLRATGAPVRLVEGIRSLVGFVGTGSDVAVSSTGTAIYVNGNIKSRLVALGVRGERVLYATPQNFSQPRWSPDGRRVALTTVQSGRSDVWLLDSRDGTLSRLTSDGPANDRPEWTADGSRILFRSKRDTPFSALYWQPADGSGPAQLLYADPQRDVWQGQLLRDGHTLIYRSGTLVTADIWAADIRSHDRPRPLLNSRFAETEPRLSPDEKWLAYNSNETGTQQVYVRAFPSGADRVQISVDGGTQPIWSRDGRHLYFVHDTTIVDATLAIGPTVSVASRSIRAAGAFSFVNGHAGYDVGPDGSIVVPKRIANDTRVIVIRDWQSALESLVGKSGR